ncbi:hypothetical protein C0993_012772 [Termitomyces sp. T159_Od127]|nr:hypothetical protein C0993_012772 [Termitomyces sp. T159_Od127]
MPTVTSIQSLVKTLAALSTNLPLSVKPGTKGDKIWSVMNTEQGETLHETFNRRFDAMFGEDCRDSSGRLEHVRRGKLGLGLVCSYLAKLDWADGFPLDIVEIKLERLISELKHLNELSVEQTSQARPTRRTLPTAKLTDENNLERPKLPFQRKAVDAYHEQQAQDAASRSSNDHLVPEVTIVDEDLPESSQEPCNESDTVEPSASRHKHSIVLDSDDEIETRVPSKKPRVSLGNPTAVGDNGLLADIDVQTINDEKATREDKRRDIDQFFHQPITKEVGGKEKKYCICKVCPENIESGPKTISLIPSYRVMSKNVKQMPSV